MTLVGVVTLLTWCPVVDAGLTVVLLTEWVVIDAGLNCIFCWTKWVVADAGLNCSLVDPLFESAWLSIRIRAVALLTEWAVVDEGSNCLWMLRDLCLRRVHSDCRKASNTPQTTCVDTNAHKRLPIIEDVSDAKQPVSSSIHCMSTAVI